MNEGDFRKKRKRGKKGENQFYNFYLKKKKENGKNRKKTTKKQPFCTKLERKREGEGPSSGFCLLKNFTNRLLKVIFIQ